MPSDVSSRHSSIQRKAYNFPAVMGWVLRKKGQKTFPTAFTPSGFKQERWIYLSGKISYLDLVLCLLLVSQAVSSVSRCFLWSTLNVVSGFEFLEDAPLITLNKPRDHFLFRANDCIPFRCVVLSNLMCVNTKK